MLDLRKGQQVALYASVATVLLASVKAVVGYLAGSVLLIADAVHSGTDVLCILASWLGLKLAARKPTDKFPYGFYKAESLATLLVSLIILYAGSQILLEGLGEVRSAPALALPYVAMAVALASAAFSWILARVERKVGKKTNAQSLVANADHTQMDALSSLLVFMALAASHAGVHYIGGGLAIAFAGLIFWVGITNGRVALYSLMDASLDPEMEQAMVAVVQGIPGVLEVHDLRVRHAGPYCFGETHLHLRKSLDIARGHEIAEKVAAKVKERFPSVDTFATHIEPHVSRERRVMVPVRDDSGLDSEVMGHFGRAAYFLFAQIDDHRIAEFEVKPNNFRDQPVRAGLNVVKHFLEAEKIDALVTQEIGEIGFHALRDHYVEVYRSQEGRTAREVLLDFAEGRLESLTAPTHSSGEAPANGGRE